jgi:hypothetical protein
MLVDSFYWLSNMLLGNHLSELSSEFIVSFTIYEKLKRIIKIFEQSTSISNEAAV